MSNVIINPYNFGIPFPNTYSLDFDSVDDFVSMGDVLDFDYTDAFTFSAWIKYTHEVASNAIVCKMETSGDYRGYEFFVTSDHKLRILFYHTGSNRLDQRGGTILTTDTWYHVAVTYSGGGAFTDIEIYLNGAAETLTKLGNNNITGTSVNAIPFQIGARNSVWDFFNGNIDEVSVWNTALSSSDISTLYNSGTPNNLNTALATTPVAWYRCGDSGTFFNSNWEIPEYTKIDNWSSHSFDFDGTDDTIALNCTPTTLGITNNWTISLWVNTSDITQSYMCYFSGAPAGLTSGVAIYQFSNNRIYAYVESYTWHIYTDKLDADTWYHVAFTDNGTTQTLYLNGVSQATSTRTYDLQTADNDFHIASANGSAYFVEAMIDGVSIFDAALDVATILSLYNAGEPNNLTLAASYTNGGGTDKSGDLQGYWRLGEDSYWNGTNWWTPDYSKNTLFSQKSFELDGVDECVKLIGGTSIDATNGLTMSFWVKLNTSAAWDYMISAGGGANSQLNLRWNAGGALTSWVSGGSYATGVTIGYDTWTHVVMTINYSTGDVTFYDDSNVSGTVLTWGSTYSTALLYTIGAQTQAGANPTNGFITQFSLFKSVFDQTAVNNLYNTGKPGDLTSLNPYIWLKLGGNESWDGSKWVIVDDGSLGADWESVNMEEVDLKFDSPTNPNAGLSDGMAIDDKINNAPDNINQGLSSGMDEVAPSGRSTDVP